MVCGFVYAFHLCKWLCSNPHEQCLCVLVCVIIGVLYDLWHSSLFNTDPIPRVVILVVFQIYLLLLEEFCDFFTPCDVCICIEIVFILFNYAYC